MFKITIKHLLICIFLNASGLYAMTNQELFENKNILVLGGTGYLGRAIVGEVLKYNPKQVIVFSRDEVKHFNFIKMFGGNPKIQNVIGDVRDYQAVLSAMKSIDIVFHVAALKRMDMLESNVEEVIKTNIVSSMNVFNAAIANNVNRVLFISTDKACLPINTYGACKFVSEKVFTNYDTKKIKTKFMATRFGNILESTGSVIPFFTEKIKNGEEIPLTDPQMTRFIIEKREGVELIFNAIRYGVGGELFIRRSPSLQVTDLIEVLKKKFNVNNKVKVIGLRPGEKLHEVLINESEMERAYSFDNYFVVIPSFPGWEAAHEEDKPHYMLHGKSMKKSRTIKHYSSDEEVVSREVLEELFIKLGLM